MRLWPHGRHMFEPVHRWIVDLYHGNCWYKSALSFKPKLYLLTTITSFNLPDKKKCKRIPAKHLIDGYDRPTSRHARSGIWHPAHKGRTQHVWNVSGGSGHVVFWKMSIIFKVTYPEATVRAEDRDYNMISCRRQTEKPAEAKRMEKISLGRRWKNRILKLF